MKVASTIRREMAELNKIVDDRTKSQQIRAMAYEVREALRWVLFGRCDWTPSGTLRAGRK